MAQDKSERLSSLPPDKRQSSRHGQFKWLLQERRLLVKHLPDCFTRHRQNRSRSRPGKGVTWTVELREEDQIETGVMSRTLLKHDVSEDTCLAAILPTRPSSIVAVYLLNECSGPVRGRLKVNNLDIPLKEILKDVVIIEFPTFVIVSSAHKAIQ